MASQLLNDPWALCLVVFDDAEKMNSFQQLWVLEKNELKIWRPVMLGGRGVISEMSVQSIATTESS